ncbi:MAG: DNA-directed RNA polymerase subunit alpha [Actinomycetota bacterium]|nr:DNA-directed RNA polymerase subunit alpha [Actinomycetota bacterium]
MLEILKPRISMEKVSDFSAKFSVEPLERGFGYTLGNMLRRVLLSSLPGAAIASIRIEGVAHEFSTIPGVKEDVADIILNLKELVLKLQDDEPATIRIEAKGPKEVKAKDIILPGEVEVVNPNLHIATANKEGKIEMEMVVEKGRGYVPAERNKKPSAPIGTIPVDSLFSPIRRVSYTVENARVGQRTDYDRLILEVETNGSIDSAEAVSLAAKIVNDHMALFMEQSPDKAEEVVFAADELQKDKSLDLPIEGMDFSVRSYNCLKRQGVNTLQQLINNTEADLLNIRNFGTKSIEEVKEKLAALDLSLKQSE